MEREKKLVINPEMAWQEINGQILILDSTVNESAHELNEMGSYIFQQFIEEEKPEVVLTNIIEIYKEQVSLKEITDDFNHYLENLISLKIIIPTSNEHS